MSKVVRYTITSGFALLLVAGLSLVAPPTRYASAAIAMPDVLDHDESGVGPHDAEGSASARLSGGIVVRTPHGDVTEWGYWNAEFGYTLLGWSREDEAGVLHFDVPEDGLITVAQLQQLVLSGVIETSIEPAKRDDEKGKITGMTTQATAETRPGIVDIVGGSNPRLVGGVLRFFQYGDVTEWGYWNAEFGYTVLGWSRADGAGALRFDVPEDGPITADQLRALSDTVVEF